MTFRNDGVSLSTFPDTLDQFLIKNPYLSGDPNTLELASHFNHYFDACIGIQNFVNRVAIPSTTTFTGTSTGAVSSNVLSYYTQTYTSVVLSGDTYTFSSTVPSGFGANPFNDSRFSLGHTIHLNPVSSSLLSGIWANKAVSTTGYLNDMMNWTQVFPILKPTGGSNFDLILKFHRFYPYTTSIVSGGALFSTAASVTGTAIGGFTQLGTDWQNTANINDGVPGTFGYSETAASSASGVGADPGSYISRYLQLTNLVGGNVPITSNKVIRGIKLKVVRQIVETLAPGSTTQLPTNMSVKDYDVVLIKNGVRGTTSKPNANSWSTVSGTSTTVTYGGSGDLWGTTWTPAEINSSNFGVAVRCQFDNWVSNNGGTIHKLRANIDEIKVYIYTATIVNPVNGAASSISTFTDSLSRPTLPTGGTTTNLGNSGSWITDSNWPGTSPGWIQATKGQPFILCDTEYPTFNPDVAQGNVIQINSEYRDQPAGGILYAGDYSGAAYSGPQDQQISFEIVSWDCSGRFIDANERANRVGPMLRLNGSGSNCSFYGVILGDGVGKTAGGGYDAGGRYDKARLVKIENANLTSWSGSGQDPHNAWDSPGTRTNIGSEFTIKRKTDLGENNDYSTSPENNTCLYTFRVTNNTSGTQVNLYLYEKIGVSATTLLASGIDTSPSSTLLGGGYSGFFVAPLDNGQDRRYFIKNPTVTYYNTTSYSGSGGSGEVIADPSPDPEDGTIDTTNSFGPFDIRINLIFAQLGLTNTLDSTLT